MKMLPQSILAAVGVLTLASTGCSFVEERVWLNAGNQLYKAQKYEQAVVEYQKVVDKVDRSNWDANYMIAVSYLALYHPGSTHPKDLEYAEKAIAAFERLLELTPPDDATRDKVRGYYVGMLTQTDKADKAIAFYEGLLRKDPNNVEFLAQIAQLYAQKKGDFPKALEYYQKRAEVDPTNKEAWYTIGVVCWERSYKGKAMISNAERDEIVKKGMEALEKALSIDPEYVQALAYVNLLFREKAAVLLEGGNTQEAGLALLKADEYQKKTMALLNKARGQAGPASKTGT